MGSYRYVPLKDGVPVEPPIELESGDDDEAIELVRLSMARADCELWRGARKVAIVPRDRKPAIRLDQ
jgi:hypothetical protein